jgi:PKD repeat protein
MSPGSAFVGDPVTFKAATGDADPNEFPEVTWSFDDGATASGIIVSHAFTTPGTHIVRATATDPTGLTATAPASLTIAAPVVPRPAMAPAFGFRKLKARRGIVRVLLTCPVIATDCSGTIELRLAPKPKAKGVASKTVVLGRKHYALANGTHKTIRVKLTKSARRRLKRARHGLLVKVVAKPKGAASKSKTVRLTGR